MKTHLGVRGSGQDFAGLDLTGNRYRPSLTAVVVAAVVELVDLPGTAHPLPALQPKWAHLPEMRTSHGLPPPRNAAKAKLRAGEHLESHPGGRRSRGDTGARRGRRVLRA